MTKIPFTTFPPPEKWRITKRSEWKTWPLLLLTWALALCAASPCPAQETYRISYSPGAEIHLLARERVKAAYERAGFKVKFVPMPHKRSIMSAAEGFVDGEVGRIKGLEKRYPGLRRVDVPVISLIGAAYVSEDSDVTYYEKKLLDSMRVGTINGVQWALRELDGRQAELVSEYKLLLGMLAEKRVDIILGNTLSVEAVLKKRNSRDRHIRMLRPLIYCAALYHYVNKKHAHIIPLLEKALRELTEKDNWSDNMP